MDNKLNENSILTLILIAVFLLTKENKSIHKENINTNSSYIYRNKKLKDKQRKRFYCIE